ncbi:Mor transcription activator family protein [Pseudoruminococcus massiliensis]|uniref:Mor transcription activator family protein n=1 Tax=Pseudoruminococcus massiliensis TaxID=2086583 RepID=UPI003AB664AF
MDSFEIQLSDLRGEQREIAQAIGIKAYIELVKLYGGSNIYIAKMDKLFCIKRDAEIIRHFNGENYNSLAKQYGLSERAVRTIVADYMNEMYGSEQTSLW